MNTSLVGNYIHYKYQNYRRYGLQLKGASQQLLHKGSLNVYLHEARAETRSMMKISQDAIRAQTLQKELNQLQSHAQQGNMTTADSNLQWVVMKHFNEIFNHLDADDFDWSTFTLTPAAKKKLQEFKIKPEDVKALLGGNAKFLKVETLLKSSLGSRGKVAGQTSMNAFRTQVSNLRAAFDVLRQNLNSGVPNAQALEENIRALELAAQGLSKTVNVNSGSGIFYKTGKLTQEYSLIQLIQLTAKAIYAQTAIDLLEGTFFESVLAGASDMLAMVGAEGFQEVKQALVTGLATGGNAIQSDSFSSHVNAKKVVSKHHIARRGGNGVINYTVGAQQGKVDVKITDSSDQLMTGISAKSVSLSQVSPRHASIQVVNNTNIIYMFQKKGEFLNHYLNQTVDTVPIASVIEQSNDIMKQMILLQAIAGGGVRINESVRLGTGSARASLFALNDKSQPAGIRIIPVSQLFSKLIDNGTRLYDVNLKDTHTWKNTWDKTDKWKRITSLLHEVHSYKIKASIEKSAFKII